MKSLPNMKLGKVIICSNLVLSTLIWPQNTICVHIYPYLHLPLFTYIWPNVALITLFGKICPKLP